MAEYQSASMFLIHRHREQARSHSQVSCKQRYQWLACKAFGTSGMADE